MFADACLFSTELYVFGLGDDVHADDINDLKTDRGNEKFFFKLKSLGDLKKTFDNMIGTLSVPIFIFKEVLDSWWIVIY